MVSEALEGFFQCHPQEEADRLELVMVKRRVAAKGRSSKS